MRRLPVVAGVLVGLLMCGLAPAARAGGLATVERPRVAHRQVFELGVPLPDPTPAVVRAGCSGDPYVSCTGPGLPIYLAPLAIKPHWDYWHELGHHADYTLLDDGERNRFRRLVRDPRPWRTSPESPHEKFAEAYATCGGGAAGVWRPLGQGYGYRPTRKQHHAICGFIRRAGDRPTQLPGTVSQQAR